MTIAAAFDAVTTTGPYKFLDYYTEADRARFAGREEDLAEVVARATAEHTFVLYGRSGLGKTSLLLAGVFPVLRERGFYPIHIRILESPLVELRNAIALAVGLTCAVDTDDLEGLIATASKLAPAGVILVFDQFEEFFIRQRFQPEERRGFIHALARFLDDPAGRIRATFSLREDYLAELDDFRGAFPDILGNQYRLRPLTAFGARQAIIAPLAHAGIVYDQRLIVRLVDLLAEFDFDPLLLQIACTAVYREALSRTHLTEADLDRIGGLEGLFRRYLETALKQIMPGQVLLSRAILDALITVEQTKRALTLEALMTSDDYQGSPDEIESVLECLEKQRLIRRELRGSKIWYELTHERLVKSILDWFKLDADFANFREARNIIATGSRADRFRVQLETLLALGQLKELVRPYRDRLRLTPAQKEYMFWSAVYRRSDDVDYWARAFGYDKCRDVLVKLLADERPDARLGAAVAAGALGENQQPLAAACLKTALDDSEPEVRRAAGRSLAAIAGPAEVEGVVEALRARKTRRRALDILTDCQELGRPLAPLPWRWRSRARVELRRRLVRQNGETIRMRASRGAVAGLLAGLMWSGTVGILFMSALLWIAGVVDWQAQLVTAWMLGAVVSILLGALLGWRYARSAAKLAAVRGKEGLWLSAGVRVYLPLAALTLLAVVGNLIARSDDIVAVLLGAFGVLVVSVFTAAYVRLLRVAAWPGVTRVGLVVWCLIISSGLPLLVAVTLFGFDVPRSETVLGLWLAAAVWSFLSAVMTITFGETATRHPIGQSPAAVLRARRLVRTLAAAVALAVLPTFLFVYGRDSVPFFSSRYEVATSGPLVVPFEWPAWPRANSAYFRIEPEDGQPQWRYVAERPTAMDLRANSGQVWLGGQLLLFIPPGRSLLAASKPRPGVDAGSRLRLEALAAVGGPGALRLSEKEWTPLVLRFSRRNEQSQNGVKIGVETWEGRLNPGTFSPHAQIRLAVPLHDSLRRSIFFQTVGTVGPSVAKLTMPTSEHGVVRPRPVVFPVLSSFDGVSYPREVVPHPGDSTPPARDQYEPLYGGAMQEFEPITVAASGSFRFELGYEVTAAAGGAPILIPAVMALTVPINERAYLHDQLRTTYLQEKKYEEAIVEARRAIELEPKNADYLNNLAWTLVAAGRGREAVPLAQKAVETVHRPTAEYFDTLAHAEYAADNWAKAADAWDKALALDPDLYKKDVDPLCRDDETLHREARERARQRK